MIIFNPNNTNNTRETLLTHTYPGGRTQMTPMEIYLLSYSILLSAIYVFLCPPKSKADPSLSKTTLVLTKLDYVIVYSYMLASDAYELLQRKIS